MSLVEITCSNTFKSHCFYQIKRQLHIWIAINGVGKELLNMCIPSCLLFQEAVFQRVAITCGLFVKMDLGPIKVKIEIISPTPSTLYYKLPLSCFPAICSHSLRFPIAFMLLPNIICQVPLYCKSGYPFGLE